MVFAGLNTEMKQKSGRFPWRDNGDEERGAEGKSAGGNGQHMSMKVEMSRPTPLHSEAPLKSGAVPLGKLSLGRLAQSSNDTIQLQRSGYEMICLVSVAICSMGTWR